MDLTDKENILVKRHEIGNTEPGYAADIIESEGNEENNNETWAIMVARRKQEGKTIDKIGKEIYKQLKVDMLSIRWWWCGQLLEIFMLKRPAGLAGTAISPSASPHLSHTFPSPSSGSPAGLAGTPISPSASPHLSHTFQSQSCPAGTPITTEDCPFLPLIVLQHIFEETLSMDMAMLGVFNRVSNAGFIPHA